VTPSSPHYSHPLQPRSPRPTNPDQNGQTPTRH
jgi:hypothetical protein